VSTWIEPVSVQAPVGERPDLTAILSDSSAFTPAWVNQLLDGLPWALLGLLVIFEILLARRGYSLSRNLIWPSGLVAAAVVAFLLRLLNEKFPSTIATIWNRRLLVAKRSDV
jgi:hypothetical protein